MALNTTVCLAAIIMNLTFLTENICRRLCMRPFALAVTAAAALALANISFRLARYALTCPYLRYLRSLRHSALAGAIPRGAGVLAFRAWRQCR